MDIRFSLVEMPVTELLMARQRRAVGAGRPGHAGEASAHGDRWPICDEAAGTGYPWASFTAVVPAKSPRSDLPARLWRMVVPVRITR